MKLVFLVNDVATEKDDYATIRLARRATEMGHEVSLVSIVDLSYEADERVTGLAVSPRGSGHEDDAAILADFQDPGNEPKRIALTEVDVMMLRMDPADELPARPWSHSSSLLFAQLAAARGTIVLNDPFKLTDATNKTYFQQFPASVRPRTLISRHEKAILEFIEAEKGNAVIKPLQGSGGRGVFVVKDGSGANINQMIEATVRDGYAIVQEYLPKAADGDVRYLTLNGRPLTVDGVHACLRRYNDTDDARSNVSAGGKFEMIEPSEEVLRVVELSGPKLVRDGMYFAGLDVVGDKMMEVNVDTPGALNFIEDLTGKDFSGAVIRDLERKVMLRRQYGGGLSLSEIACM